MDLQISGKTAFITGADSGIGFAAARELQENGVKLVLSDLDSDTLKEAAKCLPQPCKMISGDVTSEDDVARMQAFCREQHCMPDILIHCAGVTGAKGNPLELSLDDWTHAWQTDFLSAMLLCRAFIPTMAEKSWGRVVGITSENAVQPYWDEAVYNTAKAATLNFFKGLSRIYAKDGVLVNTIAPAFIETPMTDGMMEQRSQKKNISFEQAVETFLDEERPYLELKRRGKPEEVAAAIAFLASARASFINGANMRVDGGAVATMQT